MDILNYFQDLFVSGTPYTVTSTPDATGTWIETETPGTTSSGVLWTASEVPSYFQKTWMSSVDLVWAIKDKLTKGSNVTIGDTKYSVNVVEDPVNVTSTGWDNLYIIGLVAKK